MSISNCLHVCIHYGRFWEFSFINWGMNFDSKGCIFFLFQEILACRIHKTVDGLPNFWNFWIWRKIVAPGTKFQAGVYEWEFPKLVIVEGEIIEAGFWKGIEHHIRGCGIVRLFNFFRYKFLSLFLFLRV